MICSSLAAAWGCSDTHQPAHCDVNSTIFMLRQSAGMLGTRRANANCDTLVSSRYFDTGVFWLNGLFSPPSLLFVLLLYYRDDRTGWGRGENLITRTLRREGHCPGVSSAVGVSARQNVQRSVGFGGYKGTMTAADPSLDVPALFLLFLFNLLHILFSSFFHYWYFSRMSFLLISIPLHNPSTLAPFFQFFVVLPSSIFPFIFTCLNLDIPLFHVPVGMNKEWVSPQFCNFWIKHTALKRENLQASVNFLSNSAQFDVLLC